MNTRICGYFRPLKMHQFGPNEKQRKILMSIVGYVKVRLGLQRSYPPQLNAPTEIVTSLYCRICDPRSTDFGFYSPEDFPPGFLLRVLTNGRYPNNVARATIPPNKGGPGAASHGCVSQGGLFSR